MISFFYSLEIVLMCSAAEGTTQRRRLLRAQQMQLPPMNPVDVTDYPQSWPCLTSKKFLSVLAGLQACWLVPKLHVCSCLDNCQVMLYQFADDCKVLRREVGPNRQVCLFVQQDRKSKLKLQPLCEEAYFIAVPPRTCFCRDNCQVMFYQFAEDCKALRREVGPNRCWYLKLVVKKVIFSSNFGPSF